MPKELAYSQSKSWELYIYNKHAPSVPPDGENGK